MKIKTPRKIANISLLEPSKLTLLEFGFLKERVISLTTRFLSQVPLFIKNVDTLEDLFSQRVARIKKKGQLLKSIQRKLALGFEVFLSEVAKNKAQVKKFAESDWSRSLRQIKASLEMLLPKLENENALEIASHDQSLRRGLRVVNHFLESVYWLRSGDVLVLDTVKLFASFVEMLQAQKSNLTRRSILDRVQHFRALRFELFRSRAARSEQGI